MRAISQDTLGGVDVLKQVCLPRPTPGLGEILVEVRAAGVNPTDWINRAVPVTISRLPLVLGWDVSGVVESVGTGVTVFKPGDEVFGMLPYPHGVGSHAEYVTAPARSFVFKPTTIDHVHAAALPLAGLTAYQALVDTAELQSGQRVLVHAAAGGVGHLAVQIAKARSAYVIGTASAAKHDFVRSLGADEVIDYRTVDIDDAVSDIDVVLDPVSIDSAARARSVAVLRVGGTLVSILPVPIAADELAGIAARGVRFESMLVEADFGGMSAIADLVESGALRPHVHATFPLAEAAEAHALGQTGPIAGKLVLTMPGRSPQRIAERVIRSAFQTGDATALDRFVRTDYIQHNPAAETGLDALKAFGATLRQHFSESSFDVKRTVRDGDLVLLYTHVVMVPGTPGAIACDIFRFENELIAEHWDVVQEIPAACADADELFTTLSGPRTNAPGQRQFTAYHKKRVMEFFQQVVVDKNVAAADEYLGDDFFGHGPVGSDTREGFTSALDELFTRFPRLRVAPKRVIGEGDVVAVHSHRFFEPGDRGQAVLDLFRIRDGNIVEHWECVQDVPEHSANDNGMF
jgi:NADPH:quinone reductase-like Zn-dependent oxidoreductase/predicted SnoaL-like aldol condensation-catalyzing enzyme